MFKRWALVAAVALSLLSACGGGGNNPTTQAPSTATLSGKVTDSSATPLASVTVTSGTATAQTDATGAYSLIVAPSANALNVLSFSKSGYALQTRTTQETLSAGASIAVDAALIPVAATVVFNPTTAQTLTVPSSTARVVLPAAALTRSDGGVPSTQVEVQLTPINPSANGDLMPGLFGVSPTQPIESFGALQVTFTDKADGAKLQLATGKTATIRIPAVSRGGVALPANIPLFYLNETTGVWVQEGTATLMGTSPSQYYEGAVTHFSTWNADQLLDTVYIKGCIKNTDSTTPTSAGVIGDGANYIGTSYAIASKAGQFSLPVKKNAITRVYAYSNDKYSQTQDVTVRSVDVTLSQCLIVAQIIKPSVAFPTITPGLGVYQGNYSGTYSGSEIGTFSISVSNAGVISGSGYSTTYDIPFTVSGTVNVAGVTLLNGTGSAGSAVYNGTFNTNTGVVSGSWRYSNTPVNLTNGTFSGTKQP